MRSNWGDRMTRWAGIGNNGKDTEHGSEQEQMTDEMKDMHDLAEGQAAADGSHEGAAADAEGHLHMVDATSELDAELAQLRGERDQLMDRLARLQAEFDNARKRETKERMDAREYTIASTVEPFLSVMDNFQLALKAEGTLEQLRSGVELILKQMEEALRGLQVAVMDSVGTQFDPRIHEALGSIDTVEYPDHQVLEEIRRGYRIREKLLRPALVRIASNTAEVHD